MTHVEFDQWATSFPIIGKAVLEDVADVVVAVHRLQEDLHLMRCPKCTAWIALQKDHMVTQGPIITVIPAFHCKARRCRLRFTLQDGFLRIVGKAPPAPKPRGAIPRGERGFGDLDP